MKNLKAFVLALALVIGIQYATAAWTSPSATPPGNNTDTPINVGDNQQNKLGSLFINTDTAAPYAIGLGVFGNSVFNGSVQIADGTQHAGYVLTSDGNGNASWQPPTGTTNSTTTITNSGFTHVVYLTSGSGNWQIPAGVTLLRATIVGAGGVGGYGYGPVGGCNGTCYITGQGGGSGGQVVATINIPSGMTSIPYSVGNAGVLNSALYTQYIYYNTPPFPAASSTIFYGITAGGGHIGGGTVSGSGNQVRNKLQNNGTGGTADISQCSSLQGVTCVGFTGNTGGTYGGGGGAGNGYGAGGGGGGGWTTGGVGANGYQSGTYATAGGSSDSVSAGSGYRGSLGGNGAGGVIEIEY